jgi:hypothetical protein
MKSYLEEAEEVLDHTALITGPGSRDNLLKAAAYLNQAIRKGEGPPGKALGRLSLVTIFLDEPQKAESLANQALVKNRYCFFARLSLFFLACQRYEGNVPFVLGDTYSATGIALNVISMGTSAISKMDKKQAVKMRALEVAEAFVQTARGDKAGNVGEWLCLGEIVLQVADTLRQYRIEEPRVYQAILQVPWHEITLGHFAEQVVELRARAEGLSYL